MAFRDSVTIVKRLPEKVCLHLSVEREKEGGSLTTEGGHLFCVGVLPNGLNGLDFPLKSIGASMPVHMTHKLYFKKNFIQ